MRTMRRAAALKALWFAVSRRRSPSGRSVGAQLAAVPRMVRMTLSGRYPGLQPGRLGLMALGLLYVVSPVDLVPEALLLLAGVADDALVVAWLAGAVLGEADAFLDWEAQAAPAQGAREGDVVPGEVVR